jgi:DNA-binding response OmpR family regulator
MNGNAPARVLLVHSDDVKRKEMRKDLQNSGFEVVSVKTVKRALSHLTSKSFSALICELSVPGAGDGFTLVNATRHLHPEAVTMVVSSHPALRDSMSALVSQADEILVTPIAMAEVVKLLKQRLGQPRNPKVNTPESVATVLEKNSAKTIAEWLVRVKGNKQLTAIPLTGSGRTGHLGTLLFELIERLRAPRLEEGNAKTSHAAVAHGRVRREQGYTAPMLVEESRILQVCIFKTLRTNLSFLDMSLLLTDVMTIADEVDSQLSQTMASFTATSDAAGV